MSIIYDALKKVENKNNPQTEDVKVVAAPSVDIKNQKKINSQPFLLPAVSIVAVIFIIVVGIYFLNSNGQAKASKQVFIPKEVILAKQPEPQSVKADPIVESKPEISVSTPAYVLQGIVYDKDSPSAIINGKAFRKSDRIDDFEVTEIGPTVVRLLNLKDSSELTLSF